MSVPNLLAHAGDQLQPSPTCGCVTMPGSCLIKTLVQHTVQGKHAAQGTEQHTAGHDLEPRIWLQAARV